ncbi:LuxR C-terminal-related transcriptional regulator [Serratia fonticola]|uniref:LuxR C-terminal-related transcriptional regulator n=1 Tax=Serratia fonticola TaxID=47917 RepID=UPI002DBC2EBD|nr:LuxR C-terminal-related transcriptional regulator [Serratia fonticola]MEB7886690.1 LuxR C-terminal-related transcriptional regulator [Serratia fonticola]
MILFDTNYPCSLSRTTFNTILETLNSESTISLPTGEAYVAFLDGDMTDVHSTIKRIYDLRRENHIIYVITLLSKGKECSYVIKHLSDVVVDKKITYDDLRSLVSVIRATKPKALTDNLFGDIWGEILKASQKEQRVIKLLLEGYSQAQIAKMLHLSIKTISGYKVKAVKRHGTRNFNELYMKKFSKNIHNV